MDGGAERTWTYSQRILAGLPLQPPGYAHKGVNEVRQQPKGGS